MSSRFRNRGALQQHSLHFGPNMTPMVDVVMVLLVFFMACAAFVGPEWFLKGLLAQRAARPGSDTAATPETEKPRPIQITLTHDFAAGGTRASGLDLTNVTLAEILTALTAHITTGPGASRDRATIEVVIAPAPNVPIQDVVRLHEGCDKLGIGRVGYLSQQPPTGP